VEIRESYLAMIRAMSGGWGAMCGALAMTRDAVENRVYERKGQGLLVETALAMQSFSQTTLFAEAVATASGGVFVKLPEVVELGNEELETKWRSLYKELGSFAHHFEDAIADGEIDKRERQILESDAARMHKIIEEMMALMLRVFVSTSSKGGEA
jgi:hypothetical protein